MGMGMGVSRRDPAVPVSSAPSAGCAQPARLARNWQTLFSLRLASTAACELTSAAPRLPSRAPLTNLRVYRWYASPNIACCAQRHTRRRTRGQRRHNTRGARAHIEAAAALTARACFSSLLLPHTAAHNAYNLSLPGIDGMPSRFRAAPLAARARRCCSPLAAAACGAACRSRRSPLAAARHCRCRWSRRPLLAAAATNITKRSHADCSLARRA